MERQLGKTLYRNAYELALPSQLTLTDRGASGMVTPTRQRCESLSCRKHRLVDCAWRLYGIGEEVERSDRACYELFIDGG